ncbi:hypothetical protein ONZ51_g11827 [Trametes cubensis]|uniref:MARVEL domain-containing protein n=1 Tax=Trametes cubensis TaxID=1111947 RepID=A0AAD7TGZ8_9APHY|nr:hypothetical protein ONZ51_g11827 [Trametes cubensis]
MNFFWLYRVLTLVSACALSIAVIVLCAQTTIDLDKLFEGFPGHLSLPYVSLGIAVGCITAFTTIVTLGLDLCCEKPFTSLPAFELPWFCVLWILWVVAGALTLLQNSQIFGETECITLSIISPLGKDFCDKNHPTAIIEFVNFALFFVYCISLLVRAFVASGQKFTAVMALNILDVATTAASNFVQ